MKRIALLVLLAASIAPCAWAQAPGAAEQELIDLERVWVDAMIRKDAAALERIYADEYLDVTPNGGTRDRGEDMAEILSEDLTIESETFDDLSVRLYTEVAIVSGVYTQKAKFQGNSITGSYRFTDVFVKRDGRWQCVSTQSTQVQTR